MVPVCCDEYMIRDAEPGECPNKEVYKRPFREIVKYLLNEITVICVLQECPLFFNAIDVCILLVIYKVT